MIYILVPLCLLLIAKIAVINIDLKELKEDYDDLKQKHESLLDNYIWR